jgi:hypothetical protein
VIDEDRFKGLLPKAWVLTTFTGRAFRLNLADFMVATDWTPTEELEIEATDKYRSTFIIRRTVCEPPDEIVGVELKRLS